MYYFDISGLERPKLPTVCGMIKAFLLLFFLFLPQVEPAFAAKAAKPSAPAPKAVDKMLKTKGDIQFFGDFYTPWHILKKTKSTIANQKIISGVKPVLAQSRINVINYEGVATGAFFPGLPHKKYFLKVPLWSPKIIKDLGIKVATLGNNHSLDLGEQGLFDTEARLGALGIDLIGAGANLAQAMRPSVLRINGATVCLTSLNRTLPPEFWAKENKAGTAYISFSATVRHIKKLKAQCDLVIPIFHWGAEGQKEPKKYQRDLARKVIKAGAATVIGHHPHVIQTAEFYMGKPIFYSLGNFVFGTNPFTGRASGLAVSFQIKNKKIASWIMTPLNVVNKEVNYIPRPYDKLEEGLGAFQSDLMRKKCKPSTKPYVHWRCA